MYIHTINSIFAPLLSCTSIFPMSAIRYILVFPGNVTKHRELEKLRTPTAFVTSRQQQ